MPFLPTTNITRAPATNSRMSPGSNPCRSRQNYLSLLPTGVSDLLARAFSELKLVATTTLPYRLGSTAAFACSY
jgi:hypothetical protein